MTVKAYAKINIGLQIVRKRDDGFHDIDTIFHRVSIFDELHFSRRERGIKLTTDLPTLTTGTDNLCIIAAIKLFEQTGYDGGIHIDLQKGIPFGAGLGGGSSDAAATLTGINDFLRLEVPQEELLKIAKTIGADVPYFMETGSAYAKGIGDILTYFHTELPYWVLVVNPDIHISTPWAYKAFRFYPALPIHNLQKTLLDNLDHPIVWVNKIRNDFESVVFQEHEEIMRVKEVLYRTGAEFALMSGSGSSVFGIYSSKEYAQEASGFFEKRYKTWITPPGFQGV